MLIFSTHYSELLNDLDRGDEVYIAKRNDKIELQRYSAANVRSDLKKAEVFDSDYLGARLLNTLLIWHLKMLLRKWCKISMSSKLIATFIYKVCGT